MRPGHSPDESDNLGPKAAKTGGDIVMLRLQLSIQKSSQPSALVMPLNHDCKRPRWGTRRCSPGTVRVNNDFATLIATGPRRKKREARQG
eukprot:7525289-Pyramimonas_sp.AAC.1